MTRYREIQENLKEKIQQGVYAIGDLLPSENELCATYHTTRTTARKALDGLYKDGFIIRHQGKGSVVCERRKSLGLLTVKGFSETVGQCEQSVFVSKPAIQDWDHDFSFHPTDQELKSDCIRFTRLRSFNNFPVILEDSWLAADCVPSFMENEFVDGSFFKTLSQRFLIEIKGSEHELRAIHANQRMSELLHVHINAPVLYISVRYATNLEGYFVYSKLYCNTDTYPIGNTYTPGK